MTAFEVVFPQSIFVNGIFLIALQMKVLLWVVVVAVVLETTSACVCDYRRGGCYW